MSVDDVRNKSIPYGRLYKMWELGWVKSLEKVTTYVDPYYGAMRLTFRSRDAEDRFRRYNWFHTKLHSLPYLASEDVTICIHRK